MAGAMEKQDEADYRFAGALVPTRQTGLAYYRRLRPFEIKEWYVLDSATGECLGYLLDGPVEGVEGYAIGRGNAAAPSAKLAAMNKQFAGEESAWEMADRLWRLAYPWKSKAWLAMRALVLAGDWIVAFATTMLRLALVVFVALLILGSIDFVWDVRALVQDIVVAWLKAVRGRL